VGIIAFSPLANGFLTSKYLNGIPEDSRAATSISGRAGASANAGGIRRPGGKTPQASTTLLRARGQSLAQMALAWTLRLPEITSALIGASKVSQIEENVAALSNLEFSGEELAEDRRVAEGLKIGMRLEGWRLVRFGHIFGSFYSGLLILFVSVRCHAFRTRRGLKRGGIFETLAGGRRDGDGFFRLARGVFRPPIFEGNNCFLISGFLDHFTNCLDLVDLGLLPLECEAFAFQIGHAVAARSRSMAIRSAFWSQRRRADISRQMRRRAGSFSSAGRFSMRVTMASAASMYWAAKRWFMASMKAAELRLGAVLGRRRSVPPWESSRDRCVDFGGVAGDLAGEFEDLLLGKPVAEAAVLPVVQVLFAHGDGVEFFRQRTLLHGRGLR
jgi:hypothetical protein